MNTNVQLLDLPDCSKMHKEMTTDLVKHDSRMKLEKFKPYGTIVRVNLATIALFRFGTTVYAIDDTCPHQGII